MAIRDELDAIKDITKRDKFVSEDFIREQTEGEQSPKQEEYQAFVKKKMEEYGIKSITEMDEETKKKFFSEIKRDWK